MRVFGLRIFNLYEYIMNRTPSKKPVKNILSEEIKPTSVMPTEHGAVVPTKTELHPDYDSEPVAEVAPLLIEEELVEKPVPIELEHILLLIKKNTDHDFSLYKPQAVIRSIQRRLDILLIDTLASYVNYLHYYPSEIPILLKCLLIHVTHFFRDPDAFELLKDQLLTSLSKHHMIDTSFRVWIPGCSTGEEAYSVAIILQECMSILNVQFDVQIFGSDIDRDVIELARAGVFTSNIEKYVSPKRLQQFFIKEGDQYRTINSIRKMIIFAVQNVINDPPFTKVDLICCRIF